jgi:hypothetical protein
MIMSKPQPANMTESKAVGSKPSAHVPGKTVEPSANALTEAELGLASGGAGGDTSAPVYCATGKH